MNWLKNLIVTKFLKGLLDKLPANNKKTYLGAILLILGVVAQVWPDNPATPLVLALIEMLKDMGAADLFNLGLGVTLTGLVHKGLKKLHYDPEAVTD